MCPAERGERMAEQALVSVIMPVWNEEHLLEESVASVLAQTLQDMEIILVDDGSTDGSWAVMERLAARDARIRLIHRENGGVSEARNAGLDVCTGKYVRFVDADDRLPPDSMRVLVDRMERDGSDLTLGAYTEVLGHQRFHRDLGRCEDTVDNDELLRRLEPLSNSFYYGVLWNKLFRGELIRAHRVRFVSGLAWGEDFSFVMQYLIYAETISYTQTAVYDYVRNPHGAVMREFFHCIRHPLAGIRDRWVIYLAYRELYVQRGQYPRYRRVLWRYLFRFTVRN